MKKSLLTTAVVVILIAINSNAMAVSTFDGYNSWGYDWNGCGSGCNYDWTGWGDGWNDDCNGWNYNWDGWGYDCNGYNNDYNCWNWNWDSWDYNYNNCNNYYNCWNWNWDGWGDCYKDCYFKCKKACPISTIPAPGAVSLVGIGVMFVGWLRKRKTLLSI